MAKVGNLLIGVSLANVRFGSKADIALVKSDVGNVRFVPKADIIVRAISNILARG